MKEDQFLFIMESMGFGRKQKEVLASVFSEINPYWIFTKVSTTGLPKDHYMDKLKEYGIEWNIWHDYWYLQAELYHHLNSGGLEKNRDKLERNWFKKNKKEIEKWNKHELKEDETIS